MLHLELLIISTYILPSMRYELIGQWLITETNVMLMRLEINPIIRVTKNLMHYQHINIQILNS